MISTKVYSVLSQCPAQYSLAGGRCYRFVTTPLSVNGANIQCATETGGQLAQIKTSDIQTELESLTGSGMHTGKFYFGIGNIITSGNAVKWVDGSNDNCCYTNWASGGAPPGGNSQKCGVLDEAQNWKWVSKSDCSTPRSYVCEATAEDVTTTTTEQTTTSVELEAEVVIPGAEVTFLSEGNCSNNFSYVFGQNCYEFFEQEVTWSEAEADCECLQGHLVSILSPGELKFIGKLYEYLSVHPTIWTGLHQNSSGLMSWSDDSPVTVQNFRSDQILGESDTYVALDSPDGNWTVQDCSALRYPYICKTKRYIVLPTNCTELVFTQEALNSALFNPNCDGNVSSVQYRLIADISVKKHCLTPCSISDVRFNVTIPMTSQCSDVNFLYDTSGLDGNCSGF